MRKLSAGAATLRAMSNVGADRWSAGQVLALAPDAAAERAARGLAGPRRWSETGYAADGDPPTLWGLCEGSGAKPYQCCVDLAQPAYRCSCPSRKVPCKHALGLLLLWSDGGVAEGEPPAWVKEWHANRAARVARKPATARSAPSAKSQARRGERIAAGLDELDRWLADQVRAGIAGLSSAGYTHWESMAARLIDAQAPGAANAVRRLATAAVDGTGEELLAGLALLRLLVSAYRRLDKLPADLAATVRSRVGIPVPAEEVLAGPRVRDRWTVLGLRDQIEEQLTVRRVWLRGADTGRFALVLAFAPPGRALGADFTVGITLDADVCFFPGAQPLRALVAERYATTPGPPGGPAGDPIAVALRSYAEALAREPWLDRWPVLLTGVVPAHDGRWHLLDRAGDALPLHRGAEAPWALVGAAGGHPATVAGEWSPGGLRPLTAWVDGRLVRV